ncbi:uncharacterized protein LOC18441248 [Amborella trichopoda]|uniref:Hemerythrin-like domain-containing protein n=1 Tax=Amborella trichopoda TaxID=13333 RepID=W1PYH3_AMBTC|nr:uncharacterized protein LOC18441248 [Amborella trichopoda]XP_020527284.1 uncharacterized protein LOC18441248 [Amborella trichopoda]ERN13011.1 hypothetical protein AMTR_s00040p00093240 [Amborella trichopoda]|eukprot:XP_020527283.1 uncharacterized protein LOC18441248 [Amborella trichopoda]
MGGCASKPRQKPKLPSPSQIVQGHPLDQMESKFPVIHCGFDVGSVPLSKFTEPKFLPTMGEDLLRKPMPALVVMTTLQHKSILFHIDRIFCWVEDLSNRRKHGPQVVVDPSMGSPRMEVKKLGRSYSQLLEFMLEHAQMEERFIFPVLERADRGLSKVANEQHAKDFPIMNGIREQIKSIGVLESGSPVYEEAFLNLSARLNDLQAHCKEHFDEEERKLLPLLEAADLSREMQEGTLGQCFEVMEATHSHLFSFFIAGLSPIDAFCYIEMVKRCGDKDRVTRIIQSLGRAPKDY